MVRAPPPRPSIHDPNQMNPNYIYGLSVPTHTFASKQAGLLNLNLLSTTKEGGVLSTPDNILQKPLKFDTAEVLCLGFILFDINNLTITTPLFSFGEEPQFSPGNPQSRPHQSWSAWSLESKIKEPPEIFNHPQLEIVA